MATADTFESFIQKERDRLNMERETIMQKRAEFDRQIAEVDRELAAIEAYELTKQGKSLVPTAPRTRTVNRTVNRTGTRRSGIRDEILSAIADSKSGLSRADLIEQFEAKGDKSFEQSISNALSALKKAGTVDAKDGTYFTV